MKPTRTSQPYRRGPRQPGMALQNMMRGSTVAGGNPKDAERAAWLAGIAKRPRRRPRPPRPGRPAR